MNNARRSSIAEITESIKIALYAIGSNKLRSALTALGVVVGITVVLLMGWFLQGLDNAWEDTISTLGTDVIYVGKYDWSGRTHWSEVRNRKNITVRQADALINSLRYAEQACPSARQWGATVAYKNEELPGIAVIGTRSQYIAVAGGSIVRGRFFSPVEDQFATPVVIIGHNVAENLFPEEDPLGKKIRIKNKKFTIIGVAEEQGTLMMDFVDNQVFIPLKLFFNLYGSGRSLSIAIKAGGQENMDNIRYEAIGKMREIRNVRPGRRDDFSINETQIFRDSIETLRIAIWGIGIGMTMLSFIVGIIGIMNIMFVSVTERTREIGIRKALGAKKRTILLQFLVESSTLCVLGSIVALILSSVSILVFLHYAEDVDFLSATLPPYQVILAVVVSICVGVIAGVGPAIRASGLEPVEALSYE